jgi:hypothetical protein
LPPLIIVMFEPGCAAPPDAAEPPPAGAGPLDEPLDEPERGGSPLPLDEPEEVPGLVEPAACPVAEAGPIALPGIAGPDSPGYITVAPIPLMTSGRCSRLPF